MHQQARPSPIHHSETDLSLNQHCHIAYQQPSISTAAEELYPACTFLATARQINQVEQQAPRWRSHRNSPGSSMKLSWPKKAPIDLDSQTPKATSRRRSRISAPHSRRKQTRNPVRPVHPVSSGHRQVSRAATSLQRCCRPVALCQVRWLVAASPVARAHQAGSAHARRIYPARLFFPNTEFSKTLLLLGTLVST